MDVSLPPELERFVKEKVASGEYRSVEELERGEEMPGPSVMQGARDEFRRLKTESRPVSLRWMPAGTLR